MTLLREMQEVRAFWAAIEAAPLDTLPMKVFADWLDEHRQTSLAFALRWAAARKRFPHVTPGGRIASWYRRPAGRIRRLGGTPAKWAVPALVFDQLRGGKDKPNRCKTLSVPEAFQRLADALAVIRHEIGWEI